MQGDAGPVEDVFVHLYEVIGEVCTAACKGGYISDRGSDRSRKGTCKREGVDAVGPVGERGEIKNAIFGNQEDTLFVIGEDEA